MTDKERMKLMVEIMLKMNNHIGLLYDLIPLHITIVNQDIIRNSQLSYQDALTQLHLSFVENANHENQT